MVARRGEIGVSPHSKAGTPHGEGADRSAESGGRDDPQWNRRARLLLGRLVGLLLLEADVHKAFTFDIDRSR